MLHHETLRSMRQEAINVLMHGAVHAYLGNVEEHHTLGIGNFCGHVSMFIAALEAVQQRFRSTKYCDLKVHGSDPGGEVPVGSPLHEKWETEEDFMVEGERRFPGEKASKHSSQSHSTTHRPSNRSESRMSNRSQLPVVPSSNKNVHSQS